MKELRQSDYDKLYSKLYSLLRNTTPLTADCGVLCEQRCCSGSENTGMLLFPGEKTELEIKENSGRRLAVCNGKCNRCFRPLSCMLFPFFPVIDESDKLTVALDYRGVSVCPLIANSEKVRFNREFLKKVKRAGIILAKDEECRKFLKETSDEIREAEELYLKLLK